MATYNQLNRFLPFNTNPINRVPTYRYPSPYGIQEPETTTTPKSNPYDLAAAYAAIKRPNKLAYQQAVEEGSPIIERGKWAKLGALIAGVGSNLGGESASNSINLGLSAYEMPQMRAKERYGERVEGLGRLAGLEDREVEQQMRIAETKHQDYWQERQESRADKLAESELRNAILRNLDIIEDVDGYSYYVERGSGKKQLIGQTGKTREQDRQDAKEALIDREDVLEWYRTREREYNRETTLTQEEIQAGRSRDVAEANARQQAADRAARANIANKLSPTEQMAQVRADLTAEINKEGSILFGYSPDDLVDFSGDTVIPTAKQQSGANWPWSDYTEEEARRKKVNEIITQSLEKSRNPTPVLPDIIPVSPTRGTSRALPVPEIPPSYRTSPAYTGASSATPRVSTAGTAPAPTSTSSPQVTDKNPLSAPASQSDFSSVLRRDVNVNTLQKTPEGKIPMRDPDGNVFEADPSEVNELLNKDEKVTIVEHEVQAPTPTPVTQPTQQDRFPTAAPGPIGTGLGQPNPYSALSPALGATSTPIQRPQAAVSRLAQTSPPIPINTPAPPPGPQGLNISRSLQQGQVGQPVTLPQAPPGVNPTIPLAPAAQNLAASPARVLPSNEALIRRNEPALQIPAPPARPNIMPAMPPNIAPNAPPAPMNPIQLNQRQPPPPPIQQRQPTAPLNVNIPPNVPMPNPIQLGQAPPIQGPPPPMNVGRNIPFPQGQRLQPPPQPALNISPAQAERGNLPGSLGPPPIGPQQGPVNPIQLGPTLGRQPSVNQYARPLEFGGDAETKRNRLSDQEITRMRAEIAPRYNAALNKTLAELRRRGIVMQVVDGVRTREEQAKLYAIGRTVDKNKPIVTNADGYNKISEHQLEGASDLMIIKNGKRSYGTKKEWNILGQIAKANGLTWGGDWESPYDPLHLQLRKVPATEKPSVKK